VNVIEKQTRTLQRTLIHFYFGNPSRNFNPNKLNPRERGSLTILLIATFACCAASAQNYSNYTQFFVNPSSVNVSYTGVDGYNSIFLGYRRQWLGLQGGPSLGYVSLQSPLSNRLSLGGVLISDTKGLLSASSANFSAAYAIDVGPGKSIRFGLSLGANWNKVDVQKLNFVTAGDPMLSELMSNSFQPLGSAGVSYHSKTFHAGISIPNIFAPAYISTDAVNFSKVAPFTQLIFNVSNRFYFDKEKSVVEPYVLYRLNSSLPSQFEVATIVHLKNKVWFGGSYKQNFGIAAMAGIHINKLSTLGYSYTFKNVGTNSISFASHEIQLAFLFGKRQKNTMMYSFVDTEIEKKKKTPAQLAAERKQKEEDAKRAALAKQQPVKKTPDTAKPKPVNVDSLANATRLIEEQEKKQAQHEAELQALLDAHLKDSTDHIVHTPPPAVERHEHVKKGDHSKELDLSNYVIVGAFRAEENARNFDNQLVNIGFPEAHYGFVTVRNIWYVYIASADDIEEARAKRDKYRQSKMFKDAWLLTVHE
jgi:type IX secretion system PorP/SprF family membrane protein